ncbi:MAG: macro domain-containing protein [Pseudomonadota bacterium]
MSYLWDSIRTAAYWRFAVFSRRGMQSVLAWFGGIFLVVQMLDFFGIYTEDRYSEYGFIAVIAVALIATIVFRRPTQSITYRLPQKDCAIDVAIGDILDAPGAVVISTNTTFDTDIADGVISRDSLQGQFTGRFFAGAQAGLDEVLDQSLANCPYEDTGQRNGKRKRFPIGTIATVTTHGRTFYFVTMANLNDQGNAQSSPQEIETALKSLWQHVKETGELQDLAVPLIGTGRGGLKLPRPKMIERIAQSFVDASKNGVFTPRLRIVVHPSDARNFEVNLWEVRDDLGRALIH